MNYVLTYRRTRDRFSVGAPAPAPVSPRASSTQEGPVGLWTGVAGEQLPGLGAWLMPFPGMCSPHSPSRGGGRSRLILQRSAHMQPPPGAWTTPLGAVWEPVPSGHGCLSDPGVSQVRSLSGTTVCRH